MEKAVFKVRTGDESSSGTWVVLEHGKRNDVIIENYEMSPWDGTPILDKTSRSPASEMANVGKRWQLWNLSADNSYLHCYGKLSKL